MINGEKLLAVIPARGGSKRLPSKNILHMMGKPLIGWSIEEAKKSVFIDDVLVSTDDKIIADVSEQFGVEVPFLRPTDLAKDESSSLNAALHALEAMQKLGRSFGYIILLQPTSPLRTAKHIDEAVSLLTEKCADSVVSVTQVEHPVEWVGEVQGDLSMRCFVENLKRNSRSQDFPVRYRLNGAIYLVAVTELLRQKSFLTSMGCYAYKMAREDSVDIDDRFDFDVAEMLMAKRVQ